MQQAWQKTVYLYNHFLNTACFARAASLAFTTILAIVPLMVISFSVISLFPSSETLQYEIQNFIFSNFVASSGKIIQEYLSLFVARVHELSLFSTIFLMVTAITMLFSIESCLNAIWGVQNQRFWVRAIIFYLLILLIAPILITFSLVLTFFFTGLLHHSIQLLSLPAEVMIKMFPMILSFIGYLLIYKMMPNCYVPWRIAVLSAVISAGLFEFSKSIFGWYLKAFPTYKIIYGAIAAFPIFLIWVYICWLIFVIGAVIGFGFSEREKKLEQVISALK